MGRYGWMNEPAAAGRRSSIVGWAEFGIEERSFVAKDAPLDDGQKRMAASIHFFSGAAPWGFGSYGLVGQKRWQNGAALTLLLVFANF